MSGMSENLSSAVIAPVSGYRYRAGDPWEPCLLYLIDELQIERAQSALSKIVAQLIYCLGISNPHQPEGSYRFIAWRPTTTVSPGCAKGFQKDRTRW